ncbi:MAG TPA: class I SAM-dependent methyltransferase [Thermoanaerobaculia bacterium]|nr:class I SAM-dependent methyltransferase [Thermoanaerobaculia bacterium]
MPTTASPAEIRAEFDAMAPLMPDRLGPAEEWLLAQLPRGRTVLDIGCGIGTIARRLASSFAHVVAVDFSPAMIAEAQRRSSSIEFVCADLFDWLREHRDAYDCIVSVSTLHHVDLGDALRAMALSLKPGGRLLVLDVLHRTNPIVNAAALVAGFRFTGWKLRRAFWRHGRNERYLTLGEAAHTASAALPGARVREHLLWRYSIVWDRPAS